MNNKLKRFHNPKAKCEKCGYRLDYDVGSIKWQCLEKDLCIKCEVGGLVNHLELKEGEG